ncbi:alpha/beta fold hydrolase [Pseudonocardia nigra]|uniref:alpha/beta fold hydrolase n=1 Tax=Pseudonocardia nigra TaxID=1921578 RepID=UPI001C5D816C|nr:alpha/beta fold hydrolase [Pseudonocardia nigra]
MAVVLGCLVALVAGCTVGPSQRPPVAVRGESMPPAAGPTLAPDEAEMLPEPQEQRAAIPFYECTEDTLVTLPTPIPADRQLRMDCGEITVPADPDQSGMGGVTLGVLRVGLADAPEDRPPLLVLGDTAQEPSARHAAIVAGQVSPALLERFTLVGLDRRGSGLDVLDCAPDTARAALVDAGTGAATAPALAALLEEARAVVQECNLALDGGLTGYRTAATAADVELLRAALGVDQLSAVGTGDGAGALAVWARTAPRAVGRLVLDGPPHPTLDQPDLAQTQAAAAEAAFTAFALACTGQPDCALGADPRATVTALVDRLRTQPLAAVDGRRLTAGATVTALLIGLGEPRGWPALAAALAAAGTGDPGPLLAVLDPVTGPRGRFDAMLATTCNDTRRRMAPGEVADLATSWRTSYPLFGGTFAMRLLACAPWPTGGPAPAAGRAEGAPPILVIGTAADPANPLDGSRRAAESIAPGVFLNWQGASTGAYPRTPCVRAAVDAMLVDGVVPQAGTLCPP